MGKIDTIKILDNKKPYGYKCFIYLSAYSEINQKIM